MSIIILLCLLCGVAAILLLVLFLLQRRQLHALELVSQQVQRIAVGDSLNSHIELHTDQRELADMVSAVNHLLGRVAAESDRVAAATAPIGSLGDRVHEAVLIHSQTIRYANPQFASLIGCSVGELIGRRLEDLVPPDHTELVADNMRRRLAGEPAAERYEIDLVGMTGQNARLELSTWVVDFEGERALLNLGHTFGHAIESATGYADWQHGEAVGTGMLIAAEMSQRLGNLDPSVVGRLRALLQRAGLPVAAPRIGAARAFDYMSVDKKVHAGRVRLVLLAGLGRAVVTSDYPDAALRDTLAAHFG